MDAESKDIFAYEVDGRPRFADPMATERKLEILLGGDLARFLEDTEAKEPYIALGALSRLAHAVCLAFDLGPPFDPATGQGVREKTWLEVLNGFVEWQEKNDKPGEGSPTSSPGTATTSVGP